MKKSLKICLSLLCGTTFFAGLSACGTDSEETSNYSFVDFENKTLIVEAGDILDVSGYMSVQDEEGNRYSASIFIEDNDGNAVEHLRYAFQVTDQDGYTVTIYAKDDDGTVLAQRVLTIDVRDTLSPNIVFGEIPAVAFVGESYALSYVVNDASTTSHSVTVHAKATDGTLGAQVSLTDNTFTPSQSGAYLVTVTATDNVNAESVKTQEVIVRNAANPYVLENYDDPISVRNMYGAISGDSKSDSVWLEEYKGRTGIVKANGYGFYPRFMRTIAQINAFADENWDYLAFDIYVDVAGEIGNMFCYTAENRFEPIRGGEWQTIKLTREMIAAAYGRKGPNGEHDYGLERWFFGTSAEGPTLSLFWFDGVKADVYFDEARFEKAVENTSAAEAEVSQPLTLGSQVAGLENCAFRYEVVSPAYERVIPQDGTFTPDTIGRYTVYTSIDSNEVYGKTVSYINVTGDYEIRLKDANAKTMMLRGETVSVPDVQLYTSAGTRIDGADVSKKVFRDGEEITVENEKIYGATVSMYDVLYICEYEGVKVTKTHTVNVVAQYDNYLEAFTSEESINRIGLIEDKRLTNPTAVWSDEYQGRFGVVGAQGEIVEVPETTDTKTEFRFISTWLKDDLEAYTNNGEWNTFTVWLYIDADGEYLLDFSKNVENSDCLAKVQGKTWTAVSISQNFFKNNRQFYRRFSANWDMSTDINWVELGSFLRIKNLPAETMVYFDSMIFEYVEGVDPNSLIETYETAEAVATNFTKADKSVQNATAEWLEEFEREYGVLKTQGEYRDEQYSTKTSFYLKSAHNSSDLQARMESGEYDYISVRLYIDKAGEYQIDFGSQYGQQYEIAVQTVTGQQWVEIKVSISDAIEKRSLYNHICTNNPNSKYALFNIDKLSADTVEELPESPDVWVYIDEIVFGKNPKAEGGEDGIYTEVYK